MELGKLCAPCNHDDIDQDIKRGDPGHQKSQGQSKKSKKREVADLAKDQYAIMAGHNIYKPEMIQHLQINFCF